MASREEIIQQIDELSSALAELEQEESEQHDFSIGQTVTFSEEGEERVGQIESVSDESANVRVMAVSGDNFEPTDDVVTLPVSELSRMDDDGSGEESEEDDPEEEENEEGEEDKPENEEDEEEIEKGQFVQWQSKDGLTKGRVIEVCSEDCVIPETGSRIDCSKKSPVALIEVYQRRTNRKTSGLEWEDTGVHVGIPVRLLTGSEELDVQKKRLLIKLKNYEAKENDPESDKTFGVIEGLASAYGKVDLGGDTVEKGAYTQTINHNDGKFQLMFDHGWGVFDVGGIASVRDTDEGLMMEGKMPLSIQKVRDGFEMVKFMNDEGKPLGLSIGYEAIKWEYDENGSVRRLKEIALHEISVTPWPMDTHARIRDAKNRKISYHGKRAKWQHVVRPTKASDAPAGNRNHEGGNDPLLEAIAEIRTDIEYYHETIK